MTANISVQFNKFANQCKEHNPFANVPRGTDVHVAAKVACALPIIGPFVSLVVRKTHDFNSPINAQKVEVLRSDRRLMHFDVVAAVATIAIAVALIATGIISLAAIVGVGMMCLGVALYAVRYVKIHHQIERFRAAAEMQSNNQL